jgi:1,4-alpha-glucan branching enzyme
MDLASESLVIDRAMALHKLVRLVTFSLAGEGYLNFMGNEFGHPEWLDFPREGNGDSYQHARRQWSLADNPELRFQYLLAFDKAMLALEHTHAFLQKTASLQQRWVQNDDKLLAFQKGNLLFAFNFHPSEEKQLTLDLAAAPKFLLDSDDAKYGGFGPRSHYEWENGRLQLSLASRTAMVLEISNA